VAYGAYVTYRRKTLSIGLSATALAFAVAATPAQAQSVDGSNEKRFAQFRNAQRG
jgi:hypothetical protein